MDGLGATRRESMALEDALQSLEAVVERVLMTFQKRG